MIKLKDILLLKEIRVTKLQNKGMKYFYVLLRNTLKDISDQAIAAKVQPNNFIKFVTKQCDLPPQIQEKGSNYLTLSVPPELQKIFPSLASTIDIRFTSRNIADLSIYGKRASDITVSIPQILTNFDWLKMSLQHEIHHLIKRGTEMDDEEPNYLFRLLYYLGDEGEIEAHAKQYAYLYFKAYPNDKTLDLQKFLSNIIPKLPEGQQNAILNYTSFGTRTEFLQDKYKVDNYVALQMKLIHKRFIKNMKYFLQLFKEKIT